MKPVLQLALDFVDLPRALAVAEEAVAGGADWLEAGTPLIKSEGLQAIRELKARWPDHVDRGRHEDHGRRPSRGGVRRQGRGPGGGRTGRRVRRHHQGVHRGGPQLRRRDHGGHDPGGRRGHARQGRSRRWAPATSASTWPSTSRCRARLPGTLCARWPRPCRSPWPWRGASTPRPRRWPCEAGASIVVVGGRHHQGHRRHRGHPGHQDRPSRPGRRSESEFFVRATGPDIREMLLRVSAANVSDALHRTGDIPGMRPLAPGVEAGRARRSRYAPTPATGPNRSRPSTRRSPATSSSSTPAASLPAVWGELATNSAIQSGVAGVVIYGARPRHRRHPRPGLPPVLAPRHAHRRGAQGVRRDRRAHQDRRASASPRATGSSATTTASASSPRTRPSSTPTGPWTCSRTRTGCARRSRPEAR